MATSTFATDLPQFSSKFRNLNLIVAGLQFVNDMLQRTNTLKLTINNLRQAPDKQSAAAALATLSNQVNGIPPDVNSGFVQDTSSASPQTPGGAASFTNFGQPGNLAAQSATQSNAQQQSARQATNPVDQLEKAKDKLNKLAKKIPW